MTTRISVFGGAYGEECGFPRSRIYRGSGVRAAAVLAGLGGQVELHTILGPTLAEDFHGVARAMGFSLHSEASPYDVWFFYQHPLSRPTFDESALGTHVGALARTADDALVFGMVEGRLAVHATRAVYDPQDGFRARHFEENGSSANTLAICASLSEGRVMTGQETPADIAAALIARPTCQVAIVKCGPSGAFVAEAGREARWVPPFQSSQVWKIGSGDVFSASFAHAWLREGQPADAAAAFASRMVAEYVATRLEVFEPVRMTKLREEARAALDAPPAPRAMPYKAIYLAAPFFTTAQQWMVDEARAALTELGCRVFSPIHEIGEGEPRVVAPADLHAIEQCGLVFALVDGLDAGTLFEIGYANALGIPVVAVAEATDERERTMVIGSGCTLTQDFATGAYTACWQLMGNV